MNMIKKLATVSALALATTGIANANCCDLKGWYVGAQGGLNIVSGKLYSKLNNVVARSSKNNSGGSAGVMAGYGHMWCNWYLAGQVQADFGSFKQSASLNGGNQSIKATSLWGVAGMLGYQVRNNWVVYARLGADYARWKLTSNALNQNKSKGKWAFAPGVGVRVSVAKNVFMNAEYKYSWFDRIGSKVDTNNSAGARPRLHAFSLGVAYKI